MLVEGVCVCIQKEDGADVSFAQNALRYRHTPLPPPPRATAVLRPHRRPALMASPVAPQQTARNQQSAMDYGGPRASKSIR